MARPIPRPTSETREFWQATAEHRLVFQHCGQCDRAQFPPGMICRGCGGTPVWRNSSGQGTIYACTVVHRAPTSDFREDVPYTIALINMEEGFRIMTNVRGEDRDRAAIGVAVRITYEDTGRDIVLPQAVLLGADSSDR